MSRAYSGWEHAGLFGLMQFIIFHFSYRFLLLSFGGYLIYNIIIETENISRIRQHWIALATPFPLSNPTKNSVPFSHFSFTVLFLLLDLWSEFIFIFQFSIQFHFVLNCCRATSSRRESSFLSFCRPTQPHSLYTAYVIVVVCPM